MASDSVRKNHIAADNEQSFRDLVENLPDGVAVTDREGKCIFANSRFARITGYSTEELLRTNIQDLVAGENSRIYEREIKELISGEAVETSFKSIISRKDGTEAAVEVSASATNWLRRKLPVVVVHEVSEPRQEAVFEANSELLLRLEENTFDIIWMVDLDLNITYVSFAIQMVLGYSPESIIGCNVSEFVDKDIYIMLKKTIAEMINSGIGSGPVLVESDMQHSDGSMIPLEISWRILFDASGVPTGVQGFSRDISVRKKAEEELKKSEMRLKSMFKNMSNGVAVFKSVNDGEDFEFIQLNPAAQMMNKVTEEYVAGKNVTEVFPGVIKNGLLDLFRKVWRTGESCLNKPVLYRDKRISGWREHFVYKLDTGEIVAIVNDITASKEAELALEEKELYYRTVLQALHEDIILVNRDYKVVDVNKAFLINAECNRQEVIGRFCYEVTHSTSVPCYENENNDCRLLDVFETGEAISFSHGHTGPDGTALYHDILLSPLKDADGKVTHVIEAMRDVTDMVEAQKDIELLATAIEQSAETIVITDLEGAIQYTNPAFEQITGYTRAEAIGKNPRILQSGEHDCSFYRKMWDTLTGGSTWSGRFLNKKKNGTLYTEDATITPVLDEHGQTTNYVAVKRDITDSLRLESQYRQAQKEESIGRLAGGVAHDLNNLLTPILGYSELLLGDLGPGDTRRDYVNEVIHAGLRARDLVQQLLAFSRKQTLNYKPLNMNSIITDLEKLLKRTIPEDIGIHLLLSSDIPNVKADISQIEQVLMNLAVNSADAMPGGGALTLKTGIVSIEEEFNTQQDDVAPGRYLLLSVSDTGCGVTEETKKHMFEPFYSTKGEQGTGLGLSTVQGIVMQHGGFVDVQDVPEGGTVFLVYLPVSEDQGSQGEGTVESIFLPTGTETILLVEDDQRVRELTLALLKQQGYNVFFAENGHEAIDFFKSFKGRIDLLLTDVVMPGMNGKELYEVIQGISPDISILFMSGYTNEIIAQHGVLEEGIVFIQKPFTIHALAGKIREALKG
ncbi:MAG: PAS domain S-box protein [Candidatus Fermentibacteria bacterium]|nr:PAS domain S-box protein [Candidatus Fermentibacteria bacterium]